MMKKSVLILAVAALSLGMTSCGKKTETTPEAATPGTAQEATTPETTTPEAETDSITKFEQLVDKYIDVLKKVKGGDVTLAQEATTLSSEISQMQETLTAEVSSWTKEQQDKYQGIVKKLTDAVTAQ